MFYNSVQGVPQKILFQNLDVMVWRDFAYLGGCGNLNVPENTIHWICDKNTIPQLNALSKTISVKATIQNNGVRYSDCH
ncbi:hypothetical protein AB3N59_19025 [Leptospira sp. WS92.C1]